ncbi:MAG: OmpH family outer membrane protein [Chitinophagaceae bacterium]|nr:OmpH family outer membrane protein [Chitinophagaceae bacterium]
MKKVLIALTLILSTVAGFAQQKIGYLNAEELLYSMPEAKKADEEITAYAKTFQEKIVAMQKDFETKYKVYEDGMKSKSFTQAVQELKEQELKNLQDNIQSTQQNAEEKVAGKRQELLKPITEKADKAIQDVAKAKGYTFIFDSSNAGLVYAASDNIIDDVKALLGIKNTPATGGTKPAPGGNKTPAPKK